MVKLLFNLLTVAEHYANWKTLTALLSSCFLVPVHVNFNSLGR